MVSSENTHVQTTANAIGSKVSSKITEHNTSNTAHSDIRNSINEKLTADTVEGVECTINYTDGTSATVELLKYA